MVSLRNIPIKNLKSNPGKTTAILIFTALMAAAVFGGTLIVRGMQQGLANVRTRLGADILVTPADAKNEFDAQTFLIQAEPGYFYMDASVLNEVRAVEGVDKASPQLFLASATASCCSAKLQIIAFDPDTDFTIQPWIRETFGGAQKLGLLDVIVGANVTVYDDYILRLYNNDCRVIGQFAPTGSTLDNAVYTNFETIKVLIDSSFDTKLNKYQSFDTNDVISSVMISLKDGYDAENVAETIESTISGVSTATSKKMVSGIIESLNSISGTVRAFIVIFCLLGTLMTVLLFALMISERRKEFASLSIIGASKRILYRMVAEESAYVNLTGGLLGIILSAVLVLGFSNLIGQKLEIGFALPDAGQIIIFALFTLGLVMLAAILSALIAAKQVSSPDTGLILKEGE
ncbi:MAG: ABC transporter permease [Anaerolineaceae bacterium]|nr:ABC transporter permease [Anaerolineaceae bacterium]